MSGNYNLLLLQMIPVAANDVAFSTHSVIVHLIILSQIAMFEVSVINSSLQEIIFT